MRAAAAALKAEILNLMRNFGLALSVRMRFVVDHPLGVVLIQCEAPGIWATPLSDAADPTQPPMTRAMRLAHAHTRRFDAAEPVCKKRAR